MYHGLCGLSSLQLILPDGTQPRWGHTVTSFRLEERVHVTTFGGCPDFVMYRPFDDCPKLADTTVMGFGEYRTVQCTQCFWQRIGRKGVRGSGS